MYDILPKLGQAALMALAMAWKTGWPLMLGFIISATLQSVVSADKMKDYLGRGTPKEVALASLAGAASSSCSYASAAIMRTLFKKGAALINALAFLFASTNLVIELGIILLLLMGWQFMVGEWLGGVLLIVVMTIAVKLTYPAKLVEEARNHEESSGGHHHMSMAVDGGSLREKLENPQLKISIAQNFVMEWSMLWKDILAGFIISGFLAAFIPNGFWQSLFLVNAPAWLQIPLNAVIGPLIAMLTFVCSVGNIPMAAILFSGGATFGGVLAFLYADLIVIPMLDTYRRYFGWRMAAYIGGILFVTMAISAFVMDIAFRALGLVPESGTAIRQRILTFSFGYTFWLNLVLGAVAIWFFWLNRRHPMDHHAHDEHHQM